MRRDVVDGPRSGGWLARAFDDHAPVLMRYLSARVGPSHCEDLLSEVFVIAMRRQSTFDRVRGTPAAWLFGIATNVLREHRRHEALHWRTAALWNDRDTTPDTPDERAVDSVDAQAAARRLLPHLSILDDLDRDILLLSSWGSCRRPR